MNPVDVAKYVASVERMTDLKVTGWASKMEARRTTVITFDWMMIRVNPY